MVLVCGRQGVGRVAGPIAIAGGWQLDCRSSYHSWLQAAEVETHCWWVSTRIADEVWQAILLCSSPQKSRRDLGNVASVPIALDCGVEKTWRLQCRRREPVSGEMCLNQMGSRDAGRLSWPVSENDQFSDL